MKRDERHRILIVEDDQIFRELLVVALTLRGYVVYVAEDGQRAMTIIKNARPHLVTVDLRMPRTDGLRFLEWLRGTRRFGSVPAIVVTAVDDKGTAVDALVSGASDVLTKPIDLDVLAARIEALLAGRSAVEDAAAQEEPETAESPAACASAATPAAPEPAKPTGPAPAPALRAQDDAVETAESVDDGGDDDDDGVAGDPAVDPRARTGTVVERRNE